jgi:putative mRNA 3-end processing factor
LAYGQSISRNGVTVSLHPAGHILGSAQVRLEFRGEVCVFSGDYKKENDGLCVPFEPIRCHTFVTESTFGLPIYRWRSQTEIFGDIHDWWRANQHDGRTSVLFCYALGKAQRLLRGLEPGTGPILAHGAIRRFLSAYEQAGVTFPPLGRTDGDSVKTMEPRGLVLAPPSADHTPWLRKLGEISTAFASGWMQIRGARRRRSLDRGFALSDHADWPGLLAAIAATGAETVWVTHGYTGPLVRWLGESGYRAEALETRFEGELAEEDPASENTGNSPAQAVPP